MGYKVQKLTIRADERGYVFEPIAPEMLAQQKNAHVVISEPGAVRGNHFHKKGTEIISVVGPALVRTRQDGIVEDHEVPEGEVFCFNIPPGISHAIKNTGRAANLLVAFNTEVHDPEAPDVVTDMMIPISP